MMFLPCIYYLKIIKNSLNVFYRHQSLKNMDLEPIGGEKCSNAPPKYKLLKFSYIHEDSYAGAGDYFRLEVEILDEKMQNSDASYGWNVAKSDLLNGLKLCKELLDIFETVGCVLWCGNPSERALRLTNIVWSRKVDSVLIFCEAISV